MAVSNPETNHGIPLFRFDNVTVDCREFRVRLGVEDVVLTPRAFDVLVYLLTNNGRVVEKQELFDKVWGETFVSDNALAKIIKEIRHGLRDPAHEPRYIETVLKRGYRSIAPVEDRSEGVSEDPTTTAAGDGAAVWLPGRERSNRTVLFSGLIVVLFVGGLLVQSTWRSAWSPGPTSLGRDTAVGTEAQQAFSNGVFLLNQGTQQSQNVRIAVAARRSFCQKSVSYLEHASDLDPNYSEAYACLARAYRCLADENASEIHPKAKDAALAAVRTDENNADAHSILATILWEQDWNWTGAETEARRSIELSPNNHEFHERYADILAAEGRLTEALQQVGMVEELSPGAALDDDWAGYIEENARQYDRAMDRFKRIKEVRSDNTTVRYGLAEVYSLKGMHDEAIAEMQEMLQLTNGRANTRAFLAVIYARAGRRHEAVEILDEYETLPHPVSELVASTYAALGEIDKAFYWLDRAYGEHSLDLVRGIKASPVWEPIQHDPRYAALLVKMRLDTGPSS